MYLNYIDKFAFFCQKVLPLVYDDSLSYYEVLSKVVAKLNETIESVNNQNEIINKFGNEIDEFEENVNNTIDDFNNLIEETIAGIATPYDSSHNYSVGDYVSYNGIIYKCVHSTTGTFNENDWKSVVIVNELFNYVNSVWTDFIDNYKQTLGVEDKVGNSKYLVSSESVLKQMLENFNSLPKFMLKAEDEKIFSWNGYECTATQVDNGDFWYTNIIASPASLPSFIEAGKTYTMYCKRSGSNIRVEAYWYSDSTTHEYMAFNATRKFTVPANTIGCIIRVYAPASVSAYQENIIAGIMDADMSNESIYNTIETLVPYWRGVYPDNSDLNDCAKNTLWFINAGYSYTNAPAIGSGVVLTLGAPAVTTHAMQICLDFHTGTIWYRYKANTWSEWVASNVANELGDDATVGASQHLVTEMLKNFNAVPIIPLKGTNATGFKWKGYECSVSQSANSNFIYNNMFYSTSSLPTGMTTGKTYYMYVNTTNTKIKVELYWKLTTGDSLVYATEFTSPKFFTVPNNAEGCLIRVFASGNTTAYTGKILSGIFNYPNSNNFLYENTITYAGIYPRNSDFNDCGQNTFVILNSGYEYTNAPPIYAGTVFTVGDYASSQLSIQIAFKLVSGEVWYRYKVAGTWHDWVSPSSSDNKNAKLFVKGNSIMVGSVWTLQDGVPTYNHLSGWNNAPYSVVAKRIGVPQQNVNSNILHSSTGFLYVPTSPSTGEPVTTGSLLDNIIGNQSLGITAANLSSYDYVMTHFWTADLSNFAIGSASSVAGDGSLAGGVKQLVEWLNTNYPECRLILVGVPPIDTSISIGGNPFTKNYVYDGNNQTIEQLDTLMHTLAETYHFKYIDWHNMNLSYYYQKYTGGMYNGNKVNNVHANNENTYRKMGEYLAEHI